jgi:hypothetical protein
MSKQARRPAASKRLVGLERQKSDEQQRRRRGTGVVGWMQVVSVSSTVARQPLSAFSSVDLFSSKFLSAVHMIVTNQLIACHLSISFSASRSPFPIPVPLGPLRHGPVQLRLGRYAGTIITYASSLNTRDGVACVEYVRCMEIKSIDNAISWWGTCMQHRYTRKIIE